jgi:hypothetical protein
MTGVSVFRINVCGRVNCTLMLSNDSFEGIIRIILGFISFVDPYRICSWMVANRSRRLKAFRPMTAQKFNMCP